MSCSTIEQLAKVRLDEPIDGYADGAPPKFSVFWLLRESGHRGLCRVAWGARHSVLKPTMQNVARLGDAEWCRAMVEGGADVDAVGGDGTTGLMAAAEFGHAETVNVLLGLGANVALADEWDERTGA